MWNIVFEICILERNSDGEKSFSREMKRFWYGFRVLYRRLFEQCAIVSKSNC